MAIDRCRYKCIYRCRYGCRFIGIEMDTDTDIVNNMDDADMNIDRQTDKDRQSGMVRQIHKDRQIDKYLKGDRSTNT